MDENNNNVITEEQKELLEDLRMEQQEQMWGTNYDYTRTSSIWKCNW